MRKTPGRRLPSTQSCPFILSDVPGLGHNWSQLQPAVLADSAVTQQNQISRSSGHSQRTQEEAQPRFCSELLSSTLLHIPLPSLTCTRWVVQDTQCSLSKGSVPWCSSSHWVHTRFILERWVQDWAKEAQLLTAPESALYLPPALATSHFPD